jgi:hypothetical protein
LLKEMDVKWGRGGGEEILASSWSTSGLCANGA